MSSEENNDKDLSYEDLLQHALDLEKQLEEKDEEIADLNQALSGGKDGKRKSGSGYGGRDEGFGRDEIIRLEAENEDLRQKIEEDAVALSELRESLATANLRVKGLETEKSSVDKRSKAQDVRIQELEKEVIESAQRSRQAELQSKEVSKQKSANVKEAQRLYEENETLKEQNKDLNAELRQHTELKQVYDEMIVKLADEKDHFEASLNQAELDKEELQTRNISLEKGLAEEQERLQVLTNSESELRLELETVKKTLQSVKEKQQAEQKAAQSEIKALKDKIRDLSDNTKVGEKQQVIDQMVLEQQNSAALIKELHDELQTADVDRRILSDKVADMEANVEQRVAERVVNERNRSKSLELTIERLQRQHAEDTEHFRLVEVEKNDVVKENEELKHWKLVYEAGHGLQELARNQKALKDENRRRAIEKEQLQTKLGALLDSNSVLDHAFEKLKGECGKDPSFTYPEMEIRAEVKSLTARLRAQVTELEQQVTALENENMKVRKALQNQAASVGEQGFKFAGMSAEMLMKVNEFASNLRDGVIELQPQPSELMKENRRLKEELQIMFSKLQNYEREIGGSLLGGGDWQLYLAAQQKQFLLQHQQQQQPFELQQKQVEEDWKRITEENAQLHDKISTLQAELLSVVSNVQQQQVEPNQQERQLLLQQQQQQQQQLQQMSEMLVRHSERVVVELQGLKKSHPADLPPTGRTPMHSIRKGAAFTFDSGTPVGNHFNLNSTMIHSVVERSAARGRDYNNLSLTQTMGSGPMTPHGKQLLNQSIHQLNLPPEEWAMDVRDVYSQLVECLEQLYEREQELEDSKSTLEVMENSLVAVRQQAAVLYLDYTQRSGEWENARKQLQAEQQALLEERDGLKLKLKRAQEVSSMLDNKDGGVVGAGTETRLVELTRKVAVFEVNEAMLSRRFISQAEQLKIESEAKNRIESDFVEMESTLKRRILYLEQYKITASSRLAFLHGKLELSVPHTEFQALQAELDLLREEHLHTLRREVEIRSAALTDREQAREAGAAKLQLLHLTADFEQSNAMVNKLRLELEHQKDITEKSLKVAKSPSDLTAIISEMARFRGEASRIEVELLASNRRTEMLTERLQVVSSELQEKDERLNQMLQRESTSLKNEADARRQELDIKLRYEGGLDREQADDLRGKLLSLESQLQEAASEVDKQKQLADIANQQAQSLSGFKQQYIDELRDLREYCTRLESRSEDELLIGKLQRQLMSMKASYRTFVKKYQFTRENIRKRELAMRILETRLDEREGALLAVQDSHRLEISALKQALRGMKNLVMQRDALEHGKGVVIKKGSESTSKKQRAVNKMKGAFFSPIGQMLLEMSSTVGDLAEQTEDALSRAAESMERCRQLDGEVEDLKEERKSLQQLVADLQAMNGQGGSGATAARDKLKRLSVPPENTNNRQPSQQILAGRLIALSEELRTSKLTSLQQRRQIQTLRQEKQHLQKLMSTVEANVAELEEEQTKASLNHIISDLGINIASNQNEFSADQRNFVHQMDGGAAVADAVIVDEANDKDTANNGDSTSPSPSRIKQPLRKSLSIETDLDEDGLVQHPVQPSPKEAADVLLQRLQRSSAELLQCRKELGAARTQTNSLQNQLAEQVAIIHEKDGQLHYYERVLREEGISAVILSSGNGRDFERQNDAGRVDRPYRMVREDQEKLQEAASATIGSLRSLLEEKNRLIEKYKERLEQLQLSRPASSSNVAKDSIGKSRASRKADELLARLSADEDMRIRLAAKDSDNNGLDRIREEADRRRLLEQLDQADKILSDKINIIHQLEEKLLAQSNQRERAEARCGEALQELESMKTDMVTLVQQLSESEIRRLNAEAAVNDQSHLMNSVEPPHMLQSSTVQVPTQQPKLVDQQQQQQQQQQQLNNRIKDLEKANRAKAEKIRGYRAIIIRLKDQFIASETDHAAAVAELKIKSNSSAPASTVVSVDELKDLRKKVSDLHEGLRLARDDLDRARQARQQLTGEKQHALDQLRNAQEACKSAENQTNTAQEAYRRVKKDLEESRRREVRVKERLKEYVDGDGQETAKGSAAKELARCRERVVVLEREMELLQAQNAVLRRDKGVSLYRDGSMDEEKGRDERTAGFEEASKTVGVRIGSSVVDTGPMGDVRSQLHAKWEVEKKLQKRSTQLEKRLEEKLQENEDLRRQLEKVNNLLALRDEKDKEREKNKDKDKQDAEKKVLTSSLLQSEAANHRVLELESEVLKWRRQAEVDLRNEVSTMSQQLAALRDQNAELTADLEDAEARLKAQRSNLTSSGSLPDMDQQFRIRERRLREELSLARRQRQEAEAILLERDAAAVELKFDLEAAAIDKHRLVGRLREFETQSQLQVGKGPSRGSTGTVKGQRESELEGVVEAMKKLVDKLKAENDRLRKGGVATMADESPSGSNLVESSKRLAAEKRKLEKAEEEIKQLQQRQKGAEEVQARDKQRLQLLQQQANSLKKQLQSKEEAATEWRVKAEEAQAAAARLDMQLQAQAGQTQQQMQAQQQTLTLAQQQLHAQTGRAEQQLRELQRDNQRLQAELARQQQHHQPAQGPAAGQRDDVELSRLKEENRKLKMELSAFDLDFFEEIENLKYAHAEAVRKLKFYENTGGGGSRGGRSS